MQQHEIDALHADSIVIDGRDPTHLMYELTSSPKPEYFDILEAGGLTATVADAAWISADFVGATRSVMAWHRRVRDRNGRARIVLSSEDFRSAKENDQVGIVLSFQSPDPLEDDPTLVEAFWKLGVRAIQVTYQRRNTMGDGCGEERDAGLSKLGVEMVEALNDVGIVVDLSHAGHQTSMDTAELSSRPVILSHTNARSICDTPRNAHDELLEKVAETGGVVGVSAFSNIVVKNGGNVGTSLAQFLDQVDYMVKLVGEDHVAIGTDVGESRNAFEAQLLHARLRGVGSPPKQRYVEELNTRSKMKNVTAGLVERGYSRANIQKILGENFVRVFRENWGS